MLAIARFLDLKIQNFERKPVLLGIDLSTIVVSHFLPGSLGQSAMPVCLAKEE
jgi:hypothetical protein